MTDRTAEQIDLAAILNSFIYLDDDVAGIEGGTLGEIMQLLERSYEARGEEPRLEFLQIRAAIEAHPDFGKVVLLDRSSTNDTPRWTDDLIQAATFQDAEGNYYVAYRGTGEGRWTDNGDGMTAESTLMQRAAADYFDEMADRCFMEAHAKGAEVIVTGHSKGGNESQYVTMAASCEYLIDRCYSFDGQGFSDAAMERFRMRYGEDYFERQQAKLYSICGEDDYVHDLGRQAVLPEHVYYVPSTGSGFTEWHHISNMIGNAAAGAVTYTGLRFERAADGGYLHGKQGSVGDLARVLSEKMMEMDEEDLHGTAVAMMWAIDYLCMAENRKEWENLGDNDVKISDFVDLLAHGLPVISEALMQTPEGRKLLRRLTSDLMKEARERFGPLGMVGAGAAAALLAGPVCGLFEKLGDLSSLMETGDRVIDLLEKIKIRSSKAKEMNSALQEAYARRVREAVLTVKAMTPGGKYAAAEGRITVDTVRLREIESELCRIGARLGLLEERLNRFCRSAGPPALPGLSAEAMMCDGRLRLRRCVRYLQDTADRFEKAERLIRFDDQMYRIRKQQKIAQEG